LPQPICNQELTGIGELRRLLESTWNAGPMRTSGRPRSDSSGIKLVP